MINACTFFTPPVHSFEHENFSKNKISGVIVMDKSEYSRFLSAASLDDATKFARVDDKRPNLHARPPKHFHPLLQKEKDVH